VSVLRAGVVGIGYLGRFHARKYAALPGVELTALVDIDPGRAQAMAAECGGQVFDDHRRMIGQVDVASVVVPTGAHYAVSADLLNAGIHVLVEKPMTATLAQGRRLSELAAATGRVLQVGHLERFNPAMLALTARVDTPLFIESRRISPFRERGSDTNVVMDLMIHDIDLILELVDAPVRHLDACGVPVLSREIDVANARLRFATGCIADVTASRVGTGTERSMRVFQRECCMTADMDRRTLEIRRRDHAAPMSAPALDVERLVLPAGDALLAEIRAFIDSVRRGQPPVVSAIDGLRALETAFAITTQVERNGHSWPATNPDVMGRTGPS
jgi:predicted dehydrogenase